MPGIPLLTLSKTQQAGATLLQYTQLWASALSVVQYGTPLQVPGMTSSCLPVTKHFLHSSFHIILPILFRNRKNKCFHFVAEKTMTHSTLLGSLWTANWPQCDCCLRSAHIAFLAHIAAFLQAPGPQSSGVDILRSDIGNWWGFQFWLGNWVCFRLVT